MESPITYYGGKKRMLKHIRPLIPQHRIYCEPYFGGGAVFFDKQPSYLETINDTNNFVVNFFEVARDHFPELREMISNTLHHETYHKRAWFMLKHPDFFSKVELAWAFWLSANFSFGGKLGAGWRFDNGTANSHSGIRIENKRKQFTEAIFNRLKNVQISCRDALLVIDQRDTEDTFFYLDPPYPDSDQGHYAGFTVKDLEALLEKCQAMKGRFLLSNFNHKTIQDFAKRNGWNKSSHNMPLSVSNKAYAKRKDEILVWNYQVNNLFNQQETTKKAI